MTTIDQVREEWLRVSDQLNVEPFEVTSRQWAEHATISKRQLRKLGGFGTIRFDLFGAQREQDLPATRGVQIRNNYVRNLERKVGEQEYLVERLRTSISDLLIDRIDVTKYTKKWKRLDAPPATRTLVAPMSDLHYGLIVDPTEVEVNAYNWTIAARRTARYAEQIIDWKPEHRDTTDLVLGFNGDLMNGVIHALSEGTVTPMAEQQIGTLRIFVALVDLVRHHFRRIRIKCLAGNHDRNVHKGGGRAVTQKWDSFAAPVFEALKQTFRECPDVHIDAPRTPYCTFDINGSLGLMTHGDTFLETGYVGRVVNVERIAQRVYQLDASGVFPKRIDVVVAGHVHVALNTMLPNGCELVVNGAMSGLDPYAQSLGITSSNPCQVLFESVPGHAVGDFRKVMLGCADKMSAYDALIPPPVFA